MDIVGRSKRLADEAGGGWLPAESVHLLTKESGKTIGELMLDLIALASTYSMPALSGFHVGAVGQGLSGALYFGANLEFAGCPLDQTVHAEQATVVNAGSHGESGLARLAVSAPPCGYCRQFLYELATASLLEILLANKKPTHLTDYLPGAFGPDDLGVKGGLMSPRNHQVREVQPEAESQAAQAALRAAASAYAPYTKSIGGAGLTTHGGRTFAGSYFENAAFNPSLSPVQAAVVTMVLSGESLEDVAEAAIVQVASSPIDHAAAARLVLDKVVPDVEVQKYEVRAA